MQCKENMSGIRRLSHTIEIFIFIKPTRSFPRMLIYKAISIIGWYLYFLRDISIYAAPWEENNQALVSSVIINSPVSYFLYKCIRSAESRLFC